MNNDTTLSQILAPEDDSWDMVQSDNRGLVIDDESNAEWALAVYAEKEESIREIDRTADLLIQRINHWRDQRKGVVKWQLNRFAEALHGFFLCWREKHPREKTCFLPSGQMAERTQQPEVIRDDEALVEWLEEIGLTDMVKVKKSPDWAKLKKLCDLSGEHPVYLPTGEEVRAVDLSHIPPTFNIFATGAGDMQLINAEEIPAIKEGGE